MATWYISPTGNDTTGDGSSGNPYQSVSKANAAATNADTIICKDGIYTPAMWTTSLSHHSLTIQAENKLLAIFDGQNGSNYLNLGNGVLSSYTTTLYGLTIKNIGNSSTGSRFIVNEYGNLAVNNCMFQDSYPMVGGYANGFFQGSESGITMTLSGCIFKNIIANSYSQAGIFCGAESQINGVVYGCTFYMIGVGFFMYNTGNEGHTVDFKSNILYSTVAGTYFSGPWAYNPIPTGTFNNNDTYNYTRLPTGNNNITTDPLFIDAANGDFHLRSNDSSTVSPCIGTGVTV